MTARTVPKVSVIVVSYNSADDLREALPPLAHPDLEVLVIDNASQDDVACVVQGVPDVRLTQLPGNIGWGRACNVGAGQASAPVLVFANPDARPTAEQLLDMARRLLAEPAVAAIAPRFVNPDGSVQPFYFRFPTAWTGIFYFLTGGQRLDGLLGAPFSRRRRYLDVPELPQDVDQPGAACLVVSADDFRALGGYPEDLFLFFADTDLCKRLRASGRQIRVAQDVSVVHVGGTSVATLADSEMRRHLQRDYLRYLRRHHGPVAEGLTRLAVLMLTGLLPAVWRSARGNVRDGIRQLRVAMDVLR